MNNWRQILSWSEVTWDQLEGWLVKDIARTKNDIYLYCVVQMVGDENVRAPYFEILAHWAANEEDAIKNLILSCLPRAPFAFHKDLSDLIPIRKIF